MSSSRQPGVIAHEVNNQLLAARSSLALCLDALQKLPQVDPDVRAEMLADLGNAALGIDRAGEFLRAVRDRASGALVRNERFDAVQVVRSCVTLLQPLVAEKASRLGFKAEVESVFLRGDPNGLYQVLANLIHNAADASAGVRRPIAVSLGVEDETLTIAVQDHGKGIPGEHLGRIFEPGFTTKGFGS